MITKRVFLAGIATISFTGAALAFPDVSVYPYMSLKAIYSKLKMNGTISDAMKNYGTVKTDWTWAGALAAGLKMYAFRTELEYNQSGTATDTRHARNGLYDTVRNNQSYRSYMLNGYFDIPVHSSVQPYIGIGIGIAHIKNRFTFVDVNSATKKQENRLAYQLMAGLTYEVNSAWTLDAGYRYVDKGNTKWNIASGAGRIKLESKEHQMMMGIRRTF